MTSEYDYYTDYGMEYPHISNFKTNTCPKCSKHIHNKAKYCFECGEYVSDYKEKQMKKFQNAQKQYNKNKAKKHQEFKEFALKSFDLENNPKKDQIFDYAWDKGHSEGLHRVFEELAELSDLF